jgi:hypothetical protein
MVSFEDNLNHTRIKTKGICKTHKVWLRPKLTGKYSQKKGSLGRKMTI